MQKEALLAEDRAELAGYGLDPGRIPGVHVLTLEPKETLLRQGEAMDLMYVVRGGTARVCINARNGKNLIICYYISRGILGDVELMRADRRASTTVVAVSPLRLITIPIESSRAYLRGNLAFMNFIAESLSEKLLNSSSAHAASALYSSEERLCSYILMTEHGGTFSDVLSDAAQSVGMSYRHLFRVINSLCDDGILKKTASGYRILDRELLRARSADQN